MWANPSKRYIMQTKPGLWIENTFHHISQSLPRFSFNICFLAWPDCIQELSTDKAVEAKEEQIEVEVEGEAPVTAADAVADVREPDQKVTQIKPGQCLWESTFPDASQSSQCSKFAFQLVLIYWKYRFLVFRSCQPAGLKKQVKKRPRWKATSKLLMLMWCNLTKRWDRSTQY